MQTKELPFNVPKQFNDGDVSFIKSKLRYPINTLKKIIPFVFFLMTLIVIVYFMYALLSAGVFVWSKMLGQLFPFILILATMTFGLYRYWKSLFFEKMNTSLSKSENIHLLETFFSSHHFRYQTMHDNPEVFLMNSRMSNNGNELEIVVFIAIENAIIVNSHIATTSIFPKSKRKYKELIDMLKVFFAGKNKQTFQMAHQHS